MEDGNQKDRGTKTPPAGNFEKVRAEQLKYNDLEFLNKLRKAIGLPGADNPEDIEDEDREEAGEIDAEFIEARVAQNATQPDQNKSSAVTIQQASKSNAPARSVCTKWIKGVTKKVIFSDGHQLQ